MTPYLLWLKNARGEANVGADEVTGYSGEDIPKEAPRNFTLLDVVGPRSALVAWSPVDPDSLRGEFKGYKIKTWIDEPDGEEKAREIIMRSDTSRQLVQSFKPYAVNLAVVYAFNGAYNGPPSPRIRFQTPEGKPGPVDELECFPMGSSALLLAWKKPEEVNGQLRGYRIYYQEVVGTKLGPLLERKPRINDPKTDKAKIAGLKPHSKYRITVKATTTPGEGMPYYTECETNPQATEPPSRPRGKYYLLNPEAETGHARVKVTWQPQIEGNPGSHFFVQVRTAVETKIIILLLKTLEFSKLIQKYALSKIFKI